METSGWIYAISSDNYADDHMKIGMTQEASPETRRYNMANVQGLIEPIPLKIEFARYVENCAEAEKTLHTIFKANRVKGKEWFIGISRDSIYAAFSLFSGTWYNFTQQIVKKKITKQPTIQMCLKDGDKVRNKNVPDSVVIYCMEKGGLFDSETGNLYYSLADLETKLNIPTSKRAWHTSEVFYNDTWIRIADYRDVWLAKNPNVQCEQTDDNEYENELSD